MNLEYTQMQINLRYFKDNFTLETLVSSEFILQLLIVAAVVFLAFLVEYYIRKKIIKTEANHFNLKDIFKIPSNITSCIFFSSNSFNLC